jgi:ATP-binding cassette subfamily C protein PrsD
LSRPASSSSDSIVAAALASCRGSFTVVGLFSGVINLLMLSGSLYMLQVYDRVLSSRSLQTLIGLSLLLLAAYALQGFLDGLRVRLLARIGARFDEQVSPAAFAAAQKLPLLGFKAEQALQPVRDLDQVRGFLASLGPTALLDMPWLPLFLAGAFILHPWLGWLVVAGGLVIVLLTFLTELKSREASKAQLMSAGARQAIAEASRRNAEALTAMGMGPSFQRKWRELNQRHVRDWLSASDATSGIGAFAKVFRMVLQSAVLGLGAYLAMKGEISGGAMIAASIMTSRALAPIEIAVAHWKGFVAARQGLKRLRQVLDSPAFADAQRTALPPPRRELTADSLIVAAPGKQAPILHGVSLALKAGQGLGIIGPSASGKSTLVRALVGVWRPLKGEVRLDGAALGHWEPSELGRHIGYLPQDIELFEGTVAQNIARFDPDAKDEAIVSAAQAAGAHELILRLEQGYDTRIGEAGMSLSGGQRQRIGLARALYGEPFLTVLDEPNSNLDHDGDEALTQAIRKVRERGGIVIVVTHRQTAIAGVDHVAMMAEGRIQAFGPKEEILQKVLRQGGLAAAQRQPVAVS